MPLDDSTSCPRSQGIDTARVSIAPVILGGGKRPFDYFVETVNLEHVWLLQSPFATHTSPSEHDPGRFVNCGGGWERG
jgi:hypothetical protein